MFDLDPQLQDVTKSLRHCGRFWGDRLIDEQKPLARQIATLLPQPADRLVQMGEYGQGKAESTALRVMTFLPKELQIQGPDRPSSTASTGYDRPFMGSTGNLVIIPAGEDVDLPEGFEHAEQTLWFLPRPQDFRPTLLLAESGFLVEGTGFLCVGAWLVFFEDPLALWPERVMVGKCLFSRRSWKSTTFGVDRLNSSGIEIARYRRQTQTLRQFERALCEVAGLPVLDTDGIVAHIEEQANSSLHWLQDGRSFLLPGPSPYEIGSTVEAGSGHILQLRHQALQGSDWWRGRFWTVAGVPLFVWRPGFYGVAVRDTPVVAYAYDDGSDELRARLNLGYDTEDAFWAWQAAQESRRPAGVASFASTLGLTTEGESVIVNALETFVNISASWFSVVETSLDVVDRAAFLAVQNFIFRERPAGSVCFLRGQSEAMGDDYLPEIYLHTGELVYLDEYVLAMPAP